MHSLFQRRSRVSSTCFYCNARLTPPPKHRNTFICPECSCLNQYDARGIIVGDEAAMREASLNENSFAKRGAGSLETNTLPTTTSKGPFCHTCRTNQALLISLLSNYLPDQSDPSYESRLESLPTYQRSLQERYPPVCDDCQPLVDEEIRRKDFMAQTRALGFSAQQGRKFVSQQKHRPGRWKEQFLWRVRGLMWLLTIMLSVTTNALILTDREELLSTTHTPSWNILFYCFSIFWVFWDPTWYTVQRSSTPGRTPKVTGRRTYIKCQACLWVTRLVGAVCQNGYLSHWFTSHDRIRATSSSLGLLIELLFQTLALSSLSIKRPAPIRLISSSRNTPAPPDFQFTSSLVNPPSYQADADSLLSTLSLSKAPVISKPVFGHPSLPNSVSPRVSESNVMDWAPIIPNDLTTNGNTVSGGQEEYKPVVEREGWIRPATFYAPEKPTGLEDLLQKTTLDHSAKSGLSKAPLKKTKITNPKNTLLWSGLGGAIVSMSLGIILYWKQIW